MCQLVIADLHLGLVALRNRDLGVAQILWQLARLDGKRLLFRRAILVGKRNLNLVAVVGIKPHDRYLVRGLVSFNRVGNRRVIRLADNRVIYLSSLIRLKDHQGRQWRGAVWINLDVGIIQRPRSTFDDFGIALGLLGCRIILKQMTIDIFNDLLIRNDTQRIMTIAKPATNPA